MSSNAMEERKATFVFSCPGAGFGGVRGGDGEISVWGLYVCGGFWMGVGVVRLWGLWIWQSVVHEEGERMWKVDERGRMAVIFDDV